MTRVMGPITISGSPSVRTYNLGFQPTWITMTVCSKNGSDSVAHTSEGKANINPGSGAYQFCESTFSDPSGSASYNSNAHLVQHYERVGGVITKVLSASFVAFPPNGITINADITNINYQVLIEAGN